MVIDLFDLLTKATEAYAQNKPFVLYRKPNDNILIAQFQQKINEVKSDNIHSSGFLFAPFDTNETSIFYSDKLADCFESTVSDLFFSSTINRIEVSDNSIEKNNHIKIVEKAINAIRKKQFEKVVLSRKEQIRIDKFELQKTFYLLLKTYSTAMVYCWFHPEYGLWMGATPELLCNIENNRFSTMALAGTQVAENKSDVYWSEKEKIEQQLVTDYIVEVLKPEIENVEVSKPETVKAGKLWHIKTNITGDVSDYQKIKSMLTKLHPTPAVCGMPKDITKSFIKENESYKREFYTGYLGTVSENQQLDLFVNLRCMKIEENTISIFVGGGITKDSIPINEWQETVAKATTMKNVLF